MSTWQFIGPTQKLRYNPFQADDGQRPFGPKISVNLGLSVMRIGGVWFSKAGPTYLDYQNADTAHGVLYFFHGGHTHTITSQAVHDDLVAGGYGAYLTQTS